MRMINCHIMQRLIGRRSDGVKTGNLIILPKILPPEAPVMGQSCMINVPASALGNARQDRA